MAWERVKVLNHLLPSLSRKKTITGADPEILVSGGVKVEGGLLPQKISKFQMLSDDF